MPGGVPGIDILVVGQDTDGRYEPGHDGIGIT